MRWIALAAVPSGLVIAVTAYLTTDIAAAPFLWVVPLAIYLLTFVAVFRERPWIAHANVVRFVPFVVAPLAVSLIGGEKVFWLTIIALNLVAFALLTLMCHGELYARRPEPAAADRVLSLHLVWRGDRWRLRGLLAPQIFNGNYEYPILIALALLCMPGIFTGGCAQGADRSLAMACWLSAALALVWYVTPSAAAGDAGTAVSGSAGAIGGGDAVSAATADALLRARRPELCGDRAVAARHCADRDRAQFLRRPQGRGNRRRQGPLALSRHHDSWRPALAQRRRHAGQRPAGAADLLLSGRSVSPRPSAPRAPRAADWTVSPSSASAPARLPAIARAASTGPSSRSIRK